jgi:phage shock protein PspC (stress-responsive transcriptional regulator)
VIMGLLLFFNIGALLVYYFLYLLWLPRARDVRAAV